MDLTLERPNLISLAVGFTDSETLPCGAVRELFNELLADETAARAALQYGSTAGLPELRELTARHVRELDRAHADASFYDPDGVVITNGSQQLLYLLTECLCDCGDIVLVEDPTYFVYMGIAQCRGLRCRTVRLTQNGLDLAQLERVLEELKNSGDLPKVKLFYAITYFQNPTGITTSLDNKRAVLELLRRYESAAGHPIYYIEDAAYRELAIEECAAVSALTLEEHASRVLYAGTYSKPFATGSRVGFGILPEPVRSAVLFAKGNHDFGTANLLQALLCRALKSGNYQEQLGRIRARYADKARILVSSIQKHFPAWVRWTRPTGGLYVWASLPEGMETGAESKLFQTALKREVLYVPGELCYAADPARPKPRTEMRLSFGGASNEAIAEGIARLGAAFKEMAP